MEPISAATTFATIVSLLADFVAHRSGAEGQSFNEFMVYLDEQRHDEIKALLERNAQTSVSIKALLSENQRDILERLGSLDRSMAAFAAGFDTFRELAQAAHPASALSAQAISLLHQFHDSGASKIILSEYFDGTKSLDVIDGPASGALKIADTRFLDDDLAALVELGLLGLEHNGRGDRMYSYRRAAAAFVDNSRRHSIPSPTA